MKTTVTIILIALCFTSLGAENATLVTDQSFNFVERVEAVWSHPDRERPIKVFALHVGSEAANPIGIFVLASVGSGKYARSSLWDTQIRCNGVMGVDFDHSQATLVVIEDALSEEGRPLQSRKTARQISGLDAFKLCTDKPTAPVVKMVDKKSE